MNPVERADHAPEEFARHLAEQQERMQKRTPSCTTPTPGPACSRASCSAWPTGSTPTGEARKNLR